LGRYRLTTKIDQNTIPAFSKTSNNQKGALVKNQASVTSLTLINRLRSDPLDQDGWNRFVDCYGGRIRRWCRAEGMQEVDVEDLVQNVILAMAKQMKSFHYRPGGSFRAWLKKICYRSWTAFAEKKKKEGITAESVFLKSLLDRNPNQNGLLDALVEQGELDLFEQAVFLVRRKCQKVHWQAFQKTALEGQCGAQVAAELGISVALVYQSKSRIQKLLKQEIQILDKS